MLKDFIIFKKVIKKDKVNFESYFGRREKDKKCIGVKLSNKMKEYFAKYKFPVKINISDDNCFITKTTKNDKDYKTLVIWDAPENVEENVEIPHLSIDEQLDAEKDLPF